MPHEHQHGACGCGSHADDAHQLPGEGVQDVLLGCIDHAGVEVLNERVRGSGARLLRAYDAREDESQCCESDVDEQLLLRIPFTGPVKLRALLLKSGPGDETPTQVHLYPNLTQPLDFEAANDGVPKPAQVVDSVALTRECVEYPLRASKFASVNSLTLFVPAASGGERVRLYYVGLRGEYFGPRAKAPTNIVYESAPQLKDHAKVGTETSQRLG